MEQKAQGHPSQRIGQWCWQAVDIGLIDRFGPNGLAAFCMQMGNRVSRFQTGYVYHYAFVMLLGVTALVWWLVSSGVIG